MKDTKKKVVRIPKWRLDMCIGIALHYYQDSKNWKEFEKIIRSKSFDKHEQILILNFFKKEIEPLDKNIVLWMRGFNISQAFVTQIKKLKKLGYKICKID